MTTPRHPDDNDRGVLARHPSITEARAYTAIRHPPLREHIDRVGLLLFGVRAARVRRN